MIDKNDEPKKINKSVKFFVLLLFVVQFFLFVFIVIYNNNMSGYSEIEKTKIELDNNFLYQVIKSQNNWKNLSGEDLIQKQGVDIVDLIIVNDDGKLVNNYSGDFYIDVKDNGFSILSKGIPLGLSCYNLIIGDDVKNKINNYNSLDGFGVPVLRSRNIRQDNPLDWTHYSIGSEIKNNIRHSFYNMDLLSLKKSCQEDEADSKKIDIKLYKDY